MEWNHRTTQPAQIRRIDELEPRCLPSTITITSTTITIDYSSSATVKISALGSDFLVEVTGATSRTLTPADHNSITTIHVKPENGTTQNGDSLIDLGGVVKVSSGANLKFASLAYVTLEGAAGADNIIGTSIGDTLFGNGGHDQLSGGNGDDSLRGQGGNDTLDGDEGNDILWGDAGLDSLIGDAGNDTLKGEASNDILTGGAGQDSLDGGDGGDVLNGDDDNDTLSGGTGEDLVIGGTGNDSLDGGSNSTNAGDTLKGDAGNDTARGGTGDDFIYGGNGNDALVGDSGNDVLVGGTGEDTLGAGAISGVTDDGKDILIGGYGKDTLDGGSGGDVLIGGASEYDGGDKNSELGYLRGQWLSSSVLGNQVTAMTTNATTAYVQLALNGMTIGSTTFTRPPTIYSDYHKNDLRGGDTDDTNDWFVIDDERLIVPTTVNEEAETKDLDDVVADSAEESNVLRNVNPYDPAWIDLSISAKPAFNTPTTAGITRITDDPGKAFLPNDDSDVWGGIVKNRYVTDSPWNNDGTLVRLSTESVGRSADVPTHLFVDASNNFTATALTTGAGNLSPNDWLWSLDPAKPNIQYNFQPGILTSGSSFISGTNTITRHDLKNGGTPTTVNFNNHLRYFFEGKESLAYVNGKEYVAFYGIPWESTFAVPDSGDQMRLYVVNLTDSTESNPVIVVNQPLTGQETSGAYLPSGLTASTTNFTNIDTQGLWFSPNGGHALVAYQNTATNQKTSYRLLTLNLTADAMSPYSLPVAYSTNITGSSNPLNYLYSSSGNSFTSGYFPFLWGHPVFAKGADGDIHLVGEAQQWDGGLITSAFAGTDAATKITSPVSDRIGGLVSFNLTENKYVGLTDPGDPTGDDNQREATTGHVTASNVWNPGYVFATYLGSGGQGNNHPGTKYQGEIRAIWLDDPTGSLGNRSLGFHNTNDATVGQIRYADQAHLAATVDGMKLTFSSTWGELQNTASTYVLDLPSKSNNTSAQTRVETTEWTTGTAITIKLNGSGETEITGTNGTRTPFVANPFAQLVVNGNGNANTLKLDFSNGNPIPQGGSLKFIGGDGIDTLEIINSTGAANWTITKSDGGFVLANSTGTGARSGFATYSDVENLIGGSGADQFAFRGGTVSGTITGGGGNDTLDGSQSTVAVTQRGGDGNDSIIGSGYGDSLYGDNGNDTILGGIGNDRVYGDDGSGSASDGDDSLDGQDGNDTMYGGLGNDRLIGGDGTDNLNGQSGNDSLTGSAGNDTLNGGTAGTDWIIETLADATATLNDTSLSGNGSDELNSIEQASLTGTSSNDSITSTSFNGSVTVFGLDGNDTITAGGGADVIDGGAGNDSINGGGNSDIINGGDGDDTVNGANGNDLLSGDAGDDSLLGGDGNDAIMGGTGTDVLHGENNQDLLIADSENDIIDGGTGTAIDVLQGPNLTVTWNLTGSKSGDLDVNGDWNGPTFANIEKIIGGTNSDLFLFANGVSTGITIDGGDGADTLNYSNYTTAVVVNLGTSPNGTATNTTGVLRIENVTGGAVGDTLTGSSAAESLSGGDGNDRIVGGGDNDSLYGGNGNDTILGDDGDDLILGGAGDDDLHGGSGNDSVQAGDGNDVVNGNSGDDTLAGESGNNSVAGGSGNDVISAQGGNDLLIGQSGADTINAGAGDDTLFGNEDADVLRGQGGYNTADNGWEDDRDGIDLDLSAAEVAAIMAQSWIDAI